MKEQTETHRRCRACRDWKWKHDFSVSRGGITWECRTCSNDRNLRWRYAQSDEWINIFYRKTVENARKRRRKRMDERHEAAVMYIKGLEARSWSISRIAREAGLARNTVAGVKSRNKGFITDATKERLRDVFMREVARG